MTFFFSLTDFVFFQPCFCVNTHFEFKRLKEETGIYLISLIQHYFPSA